MGPMQTQARKVAWASEIAIWKVMVPPEAHEICGQGDARARITLDGQQER